MFARGCFAVRNRPQPSTTARNRLPPCAAEALWPYLQRLLQKESIHFTLHKLHKLHTLHCTLYTSPCTLSMSHRTLYTPHLTIHTPHFPLHTPHVIYTPHSKLYTFHSTLYTSHSTLYTSHTLDSALYSPLFILHASHSTHCHSVRDRWTTFFAKGPPIYSKIDAIQLPNISQRPKQGSFWLVILADDIHSIHNSTLYNLALDFGGLIDLGGIEPCLGINFFPVVSTQSIGIQLGTWNICETTSQVWIIRFSQTPNISKPGWR